MTYNYCKCPNQKSTPGIADGEKYLVCAKSKGGCGLEIKKKETHTKEILTESSESTLDWKIFSSIKVYKGDIND